MTLLSTCSAAALAFCLAARGAELYQIDLFHQGDRGVHTYRIPALVETGRGTLIAVADARHESGRDMPARISLVIRRSFDRGTTWTPSQTLREVPEGGVGDASLLVDRKTGRVWCFHSYGPPGIGFFTAKPGDRTGPQTFQWHAIHSDDEGATWSAPQDLTPQVKAPEWEAMFAASGTDIQTRRGRLLVPLVVRDGTKAISSRNAYSDDHGRTWKVGAAAGPGTDESHNVELRDGSIMQNMRNGPRRAIAISRDGGTTFGPVSHDDALIDPTCNASIVRYSHKRRKALIFTNAAGLKRENLTVRLSFDDGETWPNARVLHAGPAAYSTVIALRDGSVGVLYEQGDKSAYERITFARFPIDWLLQ